MLSDFGPLGQPGGERLLAVAMTRARRSLVIVTCFTPADVEDGRLKHGAVALAEILDEVAARRAEPPLPDDSDPMLVDLSRRLESRGLRVALGHRGKLGLVAANGGTCIVVETDGVLMGRSLRESLRLRPEVLRRLGWHYARVHAFELFATRRPSPTASPGSPASQAAPSPRRSRSLPPRLPPEQVLSPIPIRSGTGSRPRAARTRRRRRVTTDAPPGTDPTPSSEPPRHALNENDQRLREEKPPHY